ncbi:MAG: TatD family hydrolase [Bacteroidales bacterium]|nr:TatD family hydrolase [Bacteroidales bacterium]MCF8404155.1 TatD family hydrolase [Bacteroidales bacterium]
MLSKYKYINVHAHEDNSEDCLSIINVYPEALEKMNPGKYYSIGMHPWFIPEKEVGKWLDKLEEYASHEEVVAIGECGLDKLADASMEIQQFVFERQIAIAEKVQKPLIIHCVRSFNELVEIKRTSGSEVSWIVHGFNSKMAIADLLLNHEMNLSFGKALLIPDSNASKLLPQLEEDQYLLETDDGKVKIEEVYFAAATLTDMDMEILKLAMFTNFINCFKL